MKKIILILLITLIVSVDVYPQKIVDNSAVAAVAGVAIAGVVAQQIFNEMLKEQFEHEATEWILANDTDLTEFNLKLMSFDATKIDNLNTISAIPFIVKTRKRENSYILIFVLSPGWHNAYGVDFTFVKPLVFTQEYWKQILLTYLNTAGLYSVESLDKIPVYSQVSSSTEVPKESFTSGKYFLVESEYQSLSGKYKNEQFLYKKNEGVFVNMKNIIDVDHTKIEFKNEKGKGKISFPLREDLDGDTHLIANIDDKLKIDFNEKDLNIFLKETGDLFRLKRKIILEITQELYKEGDAKGF